MGMNLKTYYSLDVGSPPQNPCVKDLVPMVAILGDGRLVMKFLGHWGCTLEEDYGTLFLSFSLLYFLAMK